jgi:hypothetical protein
MLRVDTERRFSLDSARDMVSPFDKLRALSLSRGLSNHYPDLKIGVWRRRTYQYKWEKGETTMTSLKKGEIWRNNITGMVYKVKTIKDQMVVLESAKGLNQVLTSKENLNLFYEVVSKADDHGFHLEGDGSPPAGGEETSKGFSLRVGKDID